MIFCTVRVHDIANRRSISRCSSSDCCFVRFICDRIYLQPVGTFIAVSVRCRQSQNVVKTLYYTFLLVKTIARVYILRTDIRVVCANDTDFSMQALYMFCVGNAFYLFTGKYIYMQVCHTVGSEAKCVQKTYFIHLFRSARAPIKCVYSVHYVHTIYIILLHYTHTEQAIVSNAQPS